MCCVAATCDLRYVACLDDADCTRVLSSYKLMLNGSHSVNKTLHPCIASWLHLTCLQLDLIAHLRVKGVLQRQHEAPIV